LAVGFGGFQGVERSKLYRFFTDFGKISSVKFWSGPGACSPWVYSRQPVRPIANIGFHPSISRQKSVRSDG
jgi:hypothetical protein